MHFCNMVAQPAAPALLGIRQRLFCYSLVSVTQDFRQGLAATLSLWVPRLGALDVGLFLTSVWGWADSKTGL